MLRSSSQVFMMPALDVFYLSFGQVSALSYPLHFTELVVVLELLCIARYELGYTNHLFLSAPLDT